MSEAPPAEETPVPEAPAATEAPAEPSPEAAQENKSPEGGEKDAKATQPADIDAAFENPQDISKFMDGLLNDLQANFDTMSGEILSRMTDMNDKISGLEKSLMDLLDQASDIPPLNPTSAAAVSSTNSAPAAASSK